MNRGWADIRLVVASAVTILAGAALVAGVKVSDTPVWLGVLGGFCLAMGFVSLVSAIGALFRGHVPNAVRNGTPAEGTITTLGNDNRGWRDVTTRFTTDDGVEMTATQRTDLGLRPGARKLRVGSPVLLRYNPDKPQQVMIGYPTSVTDDEPGVTYGAPEDRPTPSALTRLRWRLFPPWRARASVIRGVPTEGTIVATRAIGAGDTRRRELTVRFTTEDGREITAVDYAPHPDLEPANNRLKAGAPVSLHYNPEKPEEMRVDLPSDGHAAPQPGVPYEPDKRR